MARRCRCANELYITISLNILSVSSHITVFTFLTCGMQSMFQRSCWQMQWVFCTYAYYSPLNRLRRPVGVSVVFELAQGLVRCNDCHRCESIWSAWSTQGWSLSGFIRLDPVYCSELDVCCGISNVAGWVFPLQDLSDISTEPRYKSSWSLGYMPCINNPEICWYFSLSSFWLTPFST